jgi:hypothetical protein
LDNAQEAIPDCRLLKFSLNIAYFYQFLLLTCHVSIIFAFNDFVHFQSGQCAQQIGLVATLSTGATPTATFVWQTTSRPAPAREPPSVGTTMPPRITGAAVAFNLVNTFTFAVLFISKAVIFIII